MVRTLAAIALASAACSAGCGAGGDSTPSCDGYYSFPEIDGTAHYVDPDGTAQSLAWIPGPEAYYHDTNVVYVGWDARFSEPPGGQVTIWLNRAAATTGDYDAAEFPIEACLCDPPASVDPCEPGAGTSTCFDLSGTLTVRELWRRCPDGGDHPIPAYYDDATHDDCEQRIDVDLDVVATDSLIEFDAAITATSNPRFITTDCDG